MDLDPGFFVNYSDRLFIQNAIPFNKQPEGIVSEYMNEHMAELLVLSGDQAALMNKVITDLAPVMLDKYSGEMLATDGGTEEVTLTLEEKDGKWLVTGADTAE